MQTSGTSAQVKSGVRVAVLWLLGMAWLALVFGGMAVALTPSPHSPVLGWALLTLAAVICLATMDSWVTNVLPGLLAVGTINAIFCILTGHLTGLPANPISTLNASALTAFFAASTLLSLTFRNRSLRGLDRAAIFTFVCCIFGQAAQGMARPPAKTDAEGVTSVTFIAFSVGLVALGLAYIYDRIQGHSRQSHRDRPDVS